MWFVWAHVRGLQLTEESHRQLLEEFGPKMLPPNHPLTRHVHRIVTRILEANNLGTLKTAPLPGSPTTTWFDDPFEVQGGLDEHGSGAKQWELMVVKDDKIVNAMTSFGALIRFLLFNILVIWVDVIFRYCDSIHRNSSHSKRRRRASSHNRTRYVFHLLPCFVDLTAPSQRSDMQVSLSLPLFLLLLLGMNGEFVVARHSLERYSSNKVLLAMATLLSALGLDFGWSQMLTTLLLELPNSRKQELEGSPPLSDHPAHVDNRY